jgi:hypothetical protein
VLREKAVREKLFLPLASASSDYRYLMALELLPTDPVVVPKLTQVEALRFE